MYLLTTSTDFLLFNQPSLAAFLTCRRPIFHSSIIPQLLSRCRDDDSDDENDNKNDENDDDDEKNEFESTRRLKLRNEINGRLFIFHFWLHTSMQWYLLFAQCDTMQFASRMCIMASMSAETVRDRILLPMLENKAYFSSTLQACEITTVPAANIILPHLTTVRTLFHLTLSRTNLSVLQKVSQFPNLESLTIGSCYDWEAGQVDELVSSLVAVDFKFHRLRALHVSGVKNPLPLVKVMPNLVSLRVVYTRDESPLDLTLLHRHTPKLSSLRLGNCLLDGTLDSLAELQSLRKLHINCCGTISSLKFLDSPFLQESLRDLRLVSNVYDPGDDVTRFADEFRLCGDLQNLKRISLHYCNYFTLGCLDHLRENGKNLLELDLCQVRPPITTDAYPEFDETQTLSARLQRTVKNLRVLNLEHWTREYRGEKIITLKSYTDNKNNNNNNIASSSTEPSTASSTLRHLYKDHLLPFLTELNIAECQLVDEDLMGIASGNLKKSLTRLDLHSNLSITSQGMMPHVSALVNLMWLNCADCAIDSLDFLAGMDKLEILFAHSNQRLGDVGGNRHASFRVFSDDRPLKSLPRLVEMHINDCDLQSDDAFAHLTSNMNIVGNLKVLDCSKNGNDISESRVELLLKLQRLERLVLRTRDRKKENRLKQGLKNLSSLDYRRIELKDDDDP